MILDRCIEKFPTKFAKGGAQFQNKFAKGRYLLVVERRSKYSACVIAY